MYLLDFVRDGSIPMDQKWVALLWLRYLLSPASFLLEQQQGRPADEGRKSRISELVDCVEVLERLFALCGGDRLHHPPAVLVVDVAVAFLELAELPARSTALVLELLKCGAYGNFVPMCAGNLSGMDEILDESRIDNFSEDFEQSVSSLFSVWKESTKNAEHTRSKSSIRGLWRLEEKDSIRKKRRIDSSETALAIQDFIPGRPKRVVQDTIAQRDSEEPSPSLAEESIPLLSTVTLQQFTTKLRELFNLTTSSTQIKP